MERARWLVILCTIGLWGASTASGARVLYDIREFSAKADGQTLCTQAIQAAIDKCSAGGGGMLGGRRGGEAALAEERARHEELRAEGRRGREWRRGGGRRHRHLRADHSVPIDFAFFFFSSLFSLKAASSAIDWSASKCSQGERAREEGWQNLYLARER